MNGLRACRYRCRWIVGPLGKKSRLKIETWFYFFVLLVCFKIIIFIYGRLLSTMDIAFFVFSSFLFYYEKCINAIQWKVVCCGMLPHTTHFILHREKSCRGHSLRTIWLFIFSSTYFECTDENSNALKEFPFLWLRVNNPKALLLSLMLKR